MSPDAPAPLAPRTHENPLPWLLRPFDDPYGITWRAWNAARRLSARRTARFLAGLARPPRYQRPVFILGVPRSGTTMLFHLLRASSHLGSLRGEGHDVWRLYHHPRSDGWRSDAVGAGALGRGEKRVVDALFYVAVGRQRFVEKTPENALRIPYLLDLFPDALFVVIRRNPCDVISSIIDGWRDPAGRYRSYVVPRDLDIPGYDARRRWCFALVEGWRELASAPVPEIAFEQWRQLAVGIDQARALVAPDRWTEIYFDDLIAHPAPTLERICGRIGIPLEPALESKMAELVAEPVNALARPGRAGWRDRNADEVTALLPRIAAAAPRAGFRVDPETGDAVALDPVSAS